LGVQQWWLALVAALPLLLPLRGIFRGQHRGLIWGAFLSIFYLIVGVMEAWSNPAQRMAASVQIALVAGYMITVVLIGRRRSQP
jgi:uncharacterized membrane protein